jgi:hypothetical protein
MRRYIVCVTVVAALCLLAGGSADGRGFGGFRGGSFGGYGGYRAGGFSSFSGYHAGGYSGMNRSFGYSGYRSADTYSGWRGAGGISSYDRSYAGSRGGSVNVEGTRGAAVGPYGGAVAGGQREVTATGPGGRTYSGERQGGVAVGPYGRVVGGASGSHVATGPRGTAAGGWQSAYAGTRFPTDVGLAHYSSFGAVGAAHTTAYWSHGYLNTRAGYVRNGFGYYNCFRPAWFTAHPGCWYAAGWAAGAAWASATWANIAAFCAIPSTYVNYDYGNSIVYVNNNVYVDGEDRGTAQQYAQQATTLADQGQKADAPADQEWKALGVFALVQGEEKTSNNVFQLAINKQGIIRGNYYDGVMDTTTPVYGSVDKTTQRAAWTIGKKQDRVFETGLYNLTQPEAAVLLHLGTDRTQQLLLVRMDQSEKSK